LLLVASPGVTTVTQPPSRDDLARVRKLAQLPEEARHSRFAVSITRLTVLKSLCREPEVAARFVTYLAQRTRERVEEKARRPGYLTTQEWARHREMIDRAVENNDLLLAEYALRTVLADEASAPVWAYQTARCYAERYDSGYGTGLTPASAPLGLHRI
jgi:hypothetical protein